MGMFDELTIKYPLPIPDLPQEGWQTKDTPAQAIDFYEIREDGTLWYAKRDDNTGMPGEWSQERFHGQLEAMNSVGDWRNRYDVSFWFDGIKVIGLFILHDGKYIHGRMGTCKTCPAWVPCHSTPLPDCRVLGQWGECDRAAGDHNMPTNATTLAYARGRYGGELLTHETFACNQRPKEWPLGE